MTELDDIDYLDDEDDDEDEDDEDTPSEIAFKARLKKTEVEG